VAAVPQEVASVLAILQVKVRVETEPVKAERQREKGLAQLSDAGQGPVQAEEADQGQVLFRESPFKVASRGVAIRRPSPSRSNLRTE
jgi:hypothetical protein